MGLRQRLERVSYGVDGFRRGRRLNHGHGRRQSRVEVGEDHLASFTRSPRVAVAELVWNGLDADTEEVGVR